MLMGKKLNKHIKINALTIISIKYNANYQRERRIRGQCRRRYARSALHDECAATGAREKGRIIERHTGRKNEAYL